MRKNVFAIIVTFNGDRWIKDTIQSLLKSKYSCRIVVIDNGSSDKTLEILSGVTLIHYGKLFGTGSIIGDGNYEFYGKTTP